MTRSMDSGPPRRTWRLAAAAVFLLADTQGARPLSAAGVPGKFGAGSVSSLVIDPHTPTTLYAATDCATVLNSTDGGDTWRAPSAGLSSEQISGLSVLAIDPTTPGTLYAAGFPGGALQDDGRWQHVAHRQRGPHAAPAHVRPGGRSEPAQHALFGGRQRGVQEYERRRHLETPVPGRGLYQCRHPGHRSRHARHALRRAPNYGVFRSTDRGDTWNAINGGLRDPDVCGLSPSVPARRATLYAGIFASGRLQEHRRRRRLERRRTPACPTRTSAPSPSTPATPRTLHRAK